MSQHKKDVYSNLSKYSLKTLGKLVIPPTPPCSPVYVTPITPVFLLPETVKTIYIPYDNKPKVNIDPKVLVEPKLNIEPKVLVEPKVNIEPKLNIEQKVNIEPIVIEQSKIVLEKERNSFDLCRIS